MIKLTTESIYEPTGETVRITPKQRKELNKIASRYSRWMEPREIQGFYKEIEELGVYVPAWSAYEKNESHIYYINGAEVLNSRLVFDVYEGSEGTRNEYNIYFS